MAAKCIRKRFSKGSLTTNETVEATNVMGNISFKAIQMLKERAMPMAPVATGEIQVNGNKI